MADRRPHDIYEHIVKQRRRWLPSSIEESHGRVLSGKLNDNLPTIFVGLLEELYQWAIFRYCYDDGSVEDFIELMAQASLAARNLFSMTGLTLTAGDDIAFVDKANIEWQGKRLLVPRMGHHDAQNQSSLMVGLWSAILSGRQGDLRLLSRIPPQLFDHPDIITPQYHLLRAQFFQLLCRDRDADALNLGNTLTSLAAEMKWNSKLLENFFISELELLLSIPGRNGNEILELVKKHLDAHRKFYDTDRAKGRAIVQGLVAVPALCAAILAYRRGKLIEVDDAYFPNEIFNHAIRHTSLSKPRESSVLDAIKNLFGRKN